MLDVQDIIVKLDNPNQTIVIEAEDSREQVELYAYTCRMYLHKLIKISADNIKLTVSEEAFNDIKKSYVQ